MPPASSTEEHDPVAMSATWTVRPTTATTQSEAAPGSGQRFHVDASALKGELDWIVMCAIEKDRNRRYDTAKDLAADVQLARELGEVDRLLVADVAGGGGVVVPHGGHLAPLHGADPVAHEHAGVFGRARKWARSAVR